MVKGVLLGFVLLAGSAVAVAGDSGFYAKLGGGVAITSKKHSIIDGAMNVNGVPYKQKVNNGRIIYLGAGYNLNENIAFDLEFTDYGNLKRKFTIISTQTGVDVSPKQKLKARTLLLNAYYNFANESSFTPYVGFGLGLAQLKTKDFTVNLPSGDYFLYIPAKKKHNSLAFKISAGIGYKVNDAVSLDLGYSFAKLGKVLGVAKVEKYNAAGQRVNGGGEVTPSKPKTLYVHGLTAGIRVHF